jgi:PKD repeat protein
MKSLLHSISRQSGKKWVLLVLTFLGAYLSSTAQCSIQPQFEWRHDSLNCKRIWFINHSQPVNQNIRFTWKFGDGTSSTEYQPNHEYTQQGNYTVTLVMDSGANCIKEVSQTVQVNCDSACSIQVDYQYQKEPSQPNRVYFSGQFTIPPGWVPQFFWNFGDGTTDNTWNPTHTFASPGTYNVCFKVYLNSTCFKEVCKTIVIGDSCRLQAKFEYRIDSLQKNKVYFINQTVSDQNAVHYLWKFGDGKTSTEVSPTHTYEQAGIYEVCLVAETSNGCRSVYCTKVQIGSVICPVEPKFEWRVSQDDPHKVYFKNLTVLPGVVARYLWKFGDGKTSTEKDPVHVYEKPGEYEVCLIVEVGNLCRKVTCQKIVISAPQCNVHAKFEWKKDQQNWNRIWFNNQSQPVPNIWQTHWTYGDGTSSQDFNSFHEYANPGKYYVCLKVISLNGCIDTYCDSVVVRKPDTCENMSAFRYEPAGNNQLEIKFKPEHINTTWKYYWKFGDGKESVAITPVHKYQQPGTYNVCLTVVQKNGCQTTSCKEIKVGPDCSNLLVKFEYKRNESKPNKIHFKAISNQHLQKQTWVIRRDSTIYGFPFVVVLHQNNPTFIFPFTGWYTVCLQGHTANGCSKQYCERIYIDRVVFSSVGASPVSIFPNPARNTARIQLKVAASVKVSVTVLDESGAVKYQQQVGAQAGNNNIDLPVDKLAQGQYLVQLIYDNQVRWARFQKM